MKTKEITIEDVEQVAKDLNLTITEKEGETVLELYDSASEDDPSGTWDLVVEMLIYQLISMRNLE
jgi:hypothetical protein